MSEALVESKIDYQALEKQRSDAVQHQLKLQLRSMEVGKNDSLRRVVLRLVVEARYADASMMIDEYLKLKSFYPAVGKRAKIHASHAKDLVNAVRAKRNFPNLAQLSMSKQQEILDHALGHFEELRQTIKAIEYIVRDEAIQDIRSTVWVIRTLVYVSVILLATAFVLEFSGALGQPLWAVFNDFADTSFKFILKFIPFI